MSDKSVSLKLYETLEQNKTAYTIYLNEFFSRIDSCIASHDLPALNSYLNELSEVDDKEKKALTYSSSAYRIWSIKEALIKEYDVNLSIFWDDVSDSTELLDKYNKTIFMIRRLNSALPDEYKQEAHLFLQTVSPYVVNAAFSDPTVKLGKPDYIYITLAMDFIQNRQYNSALILLQFVNNKNNELLNLMDKLKSLIKKNLEETK